MNHQSRHQYAGPYRSRERAEQVLEDCFATGEICEGEDPRVEKIGGKWYVTERAY